MLKFSKVLLDSTRHFVARRINSVTSASAELKTITPSNPINGTTVSNDSNAATTDSSDGTVVQKATITLRSNNKIVSAAFASLQGIDRPADNIATPFIDKRIAMATTVEELLSISSNGTGVSRRHALKVVSILADWSTASKVCLADFENDPRFLRLCKVLSRVNTGAKHARNHSARNEDMSTILSVTADDEAAKLVETITLPQMVKVMSTLAYKRRRSLSLLRSLSHNITKNATALDLKQCADLLYSVSLLNYFDETLLQRITSDVGASLSKNTSKSAVVGSILTSLGMLKYKDPVLLDLLSDWMLKHHEICRQTDIFALFLTLGVLNHHPANIDELVQCLGPQLKDHLQLKPSISVDYVWSLVLLEKVTNEQLACVLNEEFLANFNESTKDFSCKWKLLNINAYASILANKYTGPRISKDSPISKMQLVNTKEKSDMVASVIDALKNLVSSREYIDCEVNTGMGFSIDARCVFDKQFNPVSATKWKASHEVAIISLDYHDMMKGRCEPGGLHVLMMRLLEQSGNKILMVPYTDYNINDNVISRVSFLKNKLKALVQ